MKKILKVFVVGLMLISLFACGSKENPKTGKVGDTLKTSFLDFTVQSVEVVDSYAGYTPEEGYKLLDIVIHTKNTMKQSIPMFDTDYILYTEEYYFLTLDAIDDTMAPLQNELGIGEEMTYHYVYEVFAEDTVFELEFMEVFDDGTEEGKEGDAYVISITIE